MRSATTSMGGRDARLMLPQTATAEAWNRRPGAPASKDYAVADRPGGRSPVLCEGCRCACYRTRLPISRHSQHGPMNRLVPPLLPPPGGTGPPTTSVRRTESAVPSAWHGLWHEARVPPATSAP